MVLIAILNKADESPPFDTHSWLSDGRSAKLRVPDSVGVAS
jgi:hypothetical protein